MILRRAHMIELRPSEEQETLLRKSCGVSRYAYNWALGRYKESLDEHKVLKLSDPKTKHKVVRVADLKKLWNADKPEWVYESPKDANQQPFANLKTSLSNFFRDLKKNSGRKSGFPQWKKRGDRDSFYCSNDRVKIPLGANQMRLPVIGPIRTGEHFKPVSTKRLSVMSVTVRRRAATWYASVSYECEIPDPVSDTTRSVACIDLGLRTFATILTSDGETTTLSEIEAPRPLEKSLKRLRALQKSLARCAGGPTKKRNKRHSGKRKKLTREAAKALKVARAERLKRRAEKRLVVKDMGEKVLYVAPVHKNREKLKVRVARCHKRVADQRKDFLDKLTTSLVRKNQAIVIEDLNITGWAANRKWSRKVGDLGFRTFRSMLTYKSPAHASHLEAMDRWYASSKTCSTCRYVHKPLGLEKLWECPECKTPHDRDVNAVQNMMQDVGLPLLAKLKGSGLLAGYTTGPVPVKSLSERRASGTSGGGLGGPNGPLLSYCTSREVGTYGVSTFLGRETHEVCAHLRALSL